MLPFSGEKRVELFRRARLEKIEGSRLLAPTGSTRRMSGFCAAENTAACASRISYLSRPGSALRILLISCGCSVLPINTRYESYQESGVDILLILAASRVIYCDYCLDS